MSKNVRLTARRTAAPRIKATVLLTGTAIALVTMPAAASAAPAWHR